MSCPVVSRFVRTLTGIVALACGPLVSLAADSPVPAGPPVIASPTGNYQSVWLTLEGGGADEKGEKFDVPLFVGFRDGKAVVTWFCHPQLSRQKRLWLDAATLAVSGAAIRGDLQGRAQLGGDRGDKGRTGTKDYVFSFDLAVSGERISGSFVGKISSFDKKQETTLAGKVRGTIQAEKQAAAEAIGADKNWPWYYGAGGALRGPDCGARLIEDLSQARPVWKSEEWVLTAYGNAPDMRYAHRGAYTAPGGGSSSPVVADGMVFIYYYRPSPAAPLAGSTHAGIAIDTRMEQARTMFDREIEGRWYLDLFRMAADDVVVAMDAATGKTLWKAVFPRRSPNLQTHKWRGLFPVPLVHAGVVYASGAGGRLYALEAKTGKLLWEFPDANPKAYAGAAPSQVTQINAATPSPLFVGGLIVHSASGSAFGLDPKSGAVCWQTKPGGVLHRWAKDGKEWLLVAATDPRKNASGVGYSVVVIHAIDPASGTSLWKAETEFRYYSYLPLLDGDMLLGCARNAQGTGKGGGDEDGGTGKALAYRIKPDGLEKAWEAPLPKYTDSYAIASIGGHVYLCGEAETVCIEIATGRVAGTVQGVGGARTQVAIAADGRMLLQPEGRHGTQSFMMVQADPHNLKALLTPATDAGTHGLAGQWFPPNLHTTAYARQPIVHPLVDGRLFVRGGDGIYCYDLRKKQP